MSKKFALYSCLLLCLASSMPYAQAMHLNRYTYLNRYADQAPLVECQICYADKTKDEMVTLSCGHIFCKECFSSGINLTLKEKNLGKIRCPHYQCYSNQLPSADIQNFLTQEQKVHLNELQTQDWFAKQSHTKHCQTPDCNFAFINESTCQSNITCEQCHKTYCAQCLINHPEYMSCQAAKEKYSTADDKANQAWKNQHSKQCPKCNANIEKNSGCDHMTCSKCRYEFCWKCMEKYPCDIARCMNIRMNHTVQAQQPAALNPVVEPAYHLPDQPEIDMHNFGYRLNRLSPEQLTDFTNTIITHLNNPANLNNPAIFMQELERTENQRANIEVRADMPRDFHGFARMLTDAGIHVHINANGTLRITAHMRWDTFNRILEQANALFR